MGNIGIKLFVFIFLISIACKINAENCPNCVALNLKWCIKKKTGFCVPKFTNDLVCDVEKLRIEECETGVASWNSQPGPELTEKENDNLEIRLHIVFTACAVVFIVVLGLIIMIFVLVLRLRRRSHGVDMFRRDEYRNAAGSLGLKLHNRHNSPLPSPPSTPRAESSLLDQIYSLPYANGNKRGIETAQVQVTVNNPGEVGASATTHDANHSEDPNNADPINLGEGPLTGAPKRVIQPSKSSSEGPKGCSGTPREEKKKATKGCKEKKEGKKEESMGSKTGSKAPKEVDMTVVEMDK